jgi:2-desacetyl-2-hydroxyethyl bacteriochlorophyllide A dehydrogenase
LCGEIWIGDRIQSRSCQFRTIWKKIMNRTSLYFTGPKQVEICQENLPAPAPGEVVVQTLLSAISPGTEMLVYRGQFPEKIPLDANIAGLTGDFAYPLKYGYACVGKVLAIGDQVNASWQDRLVFAFHPHESHFLAVPEDLISVPQGTSNENALFLPNMETAVNFVMDGKPMIGERVAVFGQGIVGLLTAALLGQFPLSGLVTFDRYPLRRSTSLELGAQASYDPTPADIPKHMRAHFPHGADLTYEISGAPEALDQAIGTAGFSGRVIIGSWYGSKQVNLDLGGYFHRSRIQITSSQVSSLSPELSGRWTKARRFEVAWEMIHKIQPARLITHQFSLHQAGEAYRLLDEKPDETIQVVFTY